MIKILFICHGNICRSPMAEFVFRDLAAKSGLADQFFVASAAISNEEYGNPVHPGTKRILNRLGISAAGKTAVRMQRSDYECYDYIIGMDGYNIQGIQRILQNGDPQHKIYKLLEFTGTSRDIADPWYTGDFETTYRDISAGCNALLSQLSG